MKKKNNYIIDFPKMSWEKPIEEELLKYCLSMARQMRSVESRNEETGWFANNSFSERAGAAAMAYETVADKIESEMRLRRNVS